MSDDNMPFIILLLQQLTQLQELNLSGNNISNCGLALLAQNRVPSCLRVLQLVDDKITRNLSKSVNDLLETHPELGIFLTRVQWKYSASTNQTNNSKQQRDNENDKDNGACILNLMDANLAGQVLLQHFILG
jgi:hypothetical protein